MRKISNLRSLVLFLTVFAFSMQSMGQDVTKLSFDNSVVYGSQENNLAILISNNFNGEYNLTSINKAKWKDITNSFSLATEKTYSTAGKVDVSKYYTKGQPLYIAFRYLGKASAKPTQRSWSIENVNLKGKDLDKTFQVTDFNIVHNSKNTEGAGWVKRADTGIRYLSNKSLTESESWAIIKILD